MRIAFSVVRGVFKLAIFILVLAFLAGAGLTLYGFLRGGIKGGGPSLPIPGGADAVSCAQVTLKGGDIDQPAGADTTPVKFIVEPGDTALAIGKRLVDAGLIKDADLFRNYMRCKELDSNIEAGDFMLSPSMTIPEIAAQLGHALSTDVKVQVTEGWRAEQIGEALSNTQGITITMESFMQLVGPGADLKGYDVPFTNDFPEGASLEGFLFPDTYLLPKDATPHDVVGRMLKDFQERVLPDDPSQNIAGKFNARHLTLYQAVTLASIVEREAVVAEERPIIASVYLNRLQNDMKLDADPTVQYALGRQADTGQWWKRPLLLDDLQFQSPYNTYLNPGLPPGPIASPGLDSLRAVAEPADTNYLYFRAACDGSGKHNFSVTFEEHQAKACP